MAGRTSAFVIAWSNQLREAADGLERQLLAYQAAEGNRMRWR